MMLYERARTGRSTPAFTAVPPAADLARSRQMMLLSVLLPTALLSAPCAMAQAQAQSQQPQSGQVLTIPAPPPSVSMDRLQHAAQELREAIHAMAQQAPGGGRNAAIAAADKAILQTQEAMVQLPSELRTSADARDAQRQLDDARRLLQGSQADPQRAKVAIEEALLRADQILEQTGHPSQAQQQVEQLIERAEAAVQRGDRDEARQALQQARQDPMRRWIATDAPTECGCCTSLEANHAPRR